MSVYAGSSGSAGSPISDQGTTAHVGAPQRATAAGVQRTIQRKERPIYKRSRGGCTTCKKRRKKCGEDFDAEGRCSRCDIGGFVCEGGRIPDSPRSFETPSTATTPPSPPFSDFIESIPVPSMALTSPSSAPLFGPPAPIADFTFTSPPSSYTTYTSSFPSANPFDPFADLAYSGALLSLFSAIPPSMPVADTSYTSKISSIAGMVHGCAAQGVVHKLRGWVLKELAEEEAFETGLQGPSPDLEAAVTIYANLDAEWLFGFKPEERTAIQNHVFQVLSANAVTRESCLAVASVLRYRLLPTEDVVARERVLRQGNKFAARAMASLHQDANFEVRLMALMDMALHSVERHGPDAGYAILALGDAFIVNQANHPHPPPYLPSLNGTTNWLLRGYCYMDAIRAMSLDIRPLFDLTVATPFPSFHVVDHIAVNGEGEVLRGVHPPLIIFIARICCLAADEKDGIRSAEEVRVLGEELEREIIAWQPSPTALLATEDSLKDLEAFSTREMWRHAILIDLRQRLYHVGSLYPSIRSSLRQIITFGGGNPSTTEASLDPHVNGCFASERGLTYFIASTCAITEYERAWCRTALSKPAIFFAGRNAAVLERLWQLTDERGMPIIDWRRALAADGRCVMLMC